MSRISIANLPNERENQVDKVSEEFLFDVQEAIAKKDHYSQRTPSKTYKPSCLGCSRMMYYMRKGYKQDEKIGDYQGIGMADTGTRRHVAIQEVLEQMNAMGMPWEYIDVADYVDRKHKEGKILNTQVTGNRGHETHLIDNDLHVSCMCDGIVRNISTNHYYLFEFKNQISFKAQYRDSIDKSHYKQIIAYSTLLDLEDVIMLYENRDTCELKCPPVYHVSEKDKSDFVDRLRKIEVMYENSMVPQAEKNSGMCKWCNYSDQCKRDGGAAKICLDTSGSTQASLGLLQ